MAPTNKINKEVVETSQKFKPAPYTFKYNFKDTILYNLAVGASTQEPEDLKYSSEASYKLILRCLNLNRLTVSIDTSTREPPCSDP